MTEVKKKTTTTKARKTTKKEVVEQAANSMEEMIKSMTPEMMQQFMAFLNSQNSPKTTNEVAGEKPKINKAYLSKIRDREVVVKSVTDGIVGYESKKTRVFYKWVNFGDTEILTIGEILELDSSSKLFLHAPLLVVEDDKVNEALGISEYKEVVEKFEDFETFLELPIDEIKKTLKMVSKDYLRTINGKVQQAINDGKLTDFRKIRELEKFIKTEFRY